MIDFMFLDVSQFVEHEIVGLPFPGVCRLTTSYVVRVLGSLFGGKIEWNKAELTLKTIIFSGGSELRRWGRLSESDAKLRRNHFKFNDHKNCWRF